MPAALKAAIDGDGDASGSDLGGLELAWSGPGGPAGGPPGTAQTVCLVVGRVAGTAELATRIAAPSLALESLIAAGYEKLGEGVLELVNGDFAVLLWDRRARRGLLARDRLGGRELFVKAEDGGLLFASEIRHLLAVLKRRPAADEVALAHWLARRPAPSGRTLLEGIQRVPAGHLVRLGERLERPRCWWAPSYRKVEASAGAEAAAGLREAMSAAVERALGPAQAPGVLLSGGFDSACVASLAQRLPRGGRSMRAYSGVFPEHPEVDESAVIAVLRESLRLDGPNRPFGGGSALSAATDFIRVWRHPPLTPNWFVWKPLLEQAAREGVDVMLDGEGGDELFGCSPYLIADLLRGGRWLRMFATARRIPGMGPSPPRRYVERAVTHYGLRGALPPALHAIARRLRSRSDPRPVWLSARAREILSDHHDPDPWKRRPGPRWWAYLVWALVESPDRLGAAQQIRREAELAGLRVNHPWRDAELVERILATDPELAFDATLDRALAREAMSGVVPEPVRTRQAKPFFNALLEDALAGVDAGPAGGLIAEPPDELARLVRSDEASHLIERRSSRTWAVEAWQIVTASAWLRSLNGG